MQIYFNKSIEPLITQMGKEAVEVGENMRYTLADAKIGECIYTRSCNSCSALLLNAGKHNFLTHIDPKYFNMKTFMEVMKSKINEFRNKYGETKALILGGWAIDRNDPFVRTPSALVYSTMANVADEIPLTMICGKRNGVKSFDNIFANKDKITIAGDTFEKIASKTKKYTPEEIENSLLDDYECVELDKSML